MKNAVIAVLVLAAVAVGAVVVANNNDKNKDRANNTTKSQPSQATSSTSNTPPPAAEDLVISYASDGFSPKTLTVKAGATVTVKNTSPGSLQLNSTPHPQHTDNAELNVGTIAAGGSLTFVVTTKGTFSYHNHLNPADSGTIVVQ